MIVKKALITIVIVTLILTTCLVGCNKTTERLGVWWWDKELGDEYLQFAADQGVTEIYYCDTSFGEDTLDFLVKCKERGIDVYMLDGNYKWLNDSYYRNKLYDKLDAYELFVQEHTDLYAGVHLDIEPHQAFEFSSNRVGMITLLIELMAELKEKYPNISFHYDIPFWLDDDVTYLGSVKPAYQHAIDIADSVTVMSYRDTAEGILRCAQDEINYAKKVGKQINISVETGKAEEDKVTFREEGIKEMEEQLSIVKTALPKHCGLVIHHVESWKELVEKGS